jgi:hypothetical protein
MNERSNFLGHYEKSAPYAPPRPQGIVFRRAGYCRFSPYMWLNYVDFEERLLKLDFGAYDVVVRSPRPQSSLVDIFSEITRHECSVIEEKEGSISIEIIEKEEEAAPR